MSQLRKNCAQAGRSGGAQTGARHNDRLALTETSYVRSGYQGAFDRLLRSPGLRNRTYLSPTMTDVTRQSRSGPVTFQTNSFMPHFSTHPCFAVNHSRVADDEAQKIESLLFPCRATGA